MAAEPPPFAHTVAQWRPLVERWLAETQGLISLEHIYPTSRVIDDCYIRSHYRVIRHQLLKAAVRLAAMLHQALLP